MIIRRGIVLSNLTDVGLERTENEDYYGYFEPEDDAQFARKGRLVIVADGMGGHQAGEVASRMAFETVRDIYAASPEDDPQQVLAEAFRVANRAIFDLARSQPAMEGMGTTCSALVLKDGQAFFAHVGDSRIYLSRDDKILQLTRDHSVVMDQVRGGLLNEADISGRADRNVINRAVGVLPSVQVDLSPLPIPTYEGDVFVLCSDGLSNLVSAEEIRQAVTTEHPRDACRKLVDLAKSRGGYDNITLQIVKLADEQRETKRSVRVTAVEPVKKSRKRLVIVLVVVIILAMLVGGYFLYRKLRQPTQPPKQEETKQPQISQILTDKKESVTHSTQVSLGPRKRPSEGSQRCNLWTIEERNGALKTRPEALAPLQGAHLSARRFQTFHVWLPSLRRLPTPRPTIRSA
jgi:protein phosphatase